MKYASTALLCALPLLAATRPIADRPQFAVKAGTVLTKVFTQSSDLSLDDFSMSLDGNDMSIELSMEQKSETHVEFTDTYVEMKDGKPGKLKRTFVTLSETESSETVSPQGEDSKEDEKSSELEGATVVFSWDEDEGDYVLAFEGEGDSDLLEELEEDTDLRRLLPKSDVADGDTWEIPGDAFGVLFSPGGDLALVGEDDEDSEEDGLTQQFVENLGGEVTATYKGMREEDGVEVAVIELSGTLSSEAEQDVNEGAGEGSATASVELDVEGLLLWNVEGGHFMTLELTASMEMSMDTQVTIQDTHEMEQSMGFSGTLEFKATATRE